MKILVCVKEVPEVNAPVRADISSGWLLLEDSHYFRMNRFDEFAVEEAIRIKESLPDVTIAVLTVGQARAEKILRRAMGMGADRAIHMLQEPGADTSPFTVASAIAQHPGIGEYDLVLTGVMAEDDMQGQTGPMLAELLGIPCATAVVLVRVFLEERFVSVEREIERGMRDVLELSLPALLTVQSGINVPRYPSLSNMLRANKAAPQVIEVSSLAMPEPRDVVVRGVVPGRSRKGLVLEGTTEKKATELARILVKRGLI
ncbi:MAG: electron transfer flavoprotein subunit beta/FixA family protein [Thermodesulfobacteriota bacterium]